MRMTKFLKLAPALYQEGISVHLVSSPGMGKSEAIEREVPRAIMGALGLPEFSIKMGNLTNMEAPDVRGFAIPKVREGKDVTVFTESPLIPHALAKHGIVFLDEFPQAGHDVQKAAADFLLAGRAGDSKLPDGWQAWSAGNRMCDKAGVNKPLSHITNRHVVINLDFHIDDWTTWAANNSIHPLFIAAANFKPSLLTEWDNAIAANKPLSGADPFCTPRSYSRWARLVTNLTNGDIGASIHENSDILELGMGMVGKAAAVETLAFMKVAADLPTINMILSDPAGTADRLPKNRLDVTLSACQLALYHIDKANADTMMQFIQRLPKEFQTSTIQRCIMKLGAAAVTTPLFAKWISENRDLVTSSFV